MKLEVSGAIALGANEVMRHPQSAYIDGQDPAVAEHFLVEEASVG